MHNDLLNGYKPHSIELELRYKQQEIWDNQPTLGANHAQCSRLPRSLRCSRPFTSTNLYGM